MRKTLKERYFSAMYPKALPRDERLPEGERVRERRNARLAESLMQADVNRLLHAGAFASANPPNPMAGTERYKNPIYRDPYMNINPRQFGDPEYFRPRPYTRWPYD